MQRLSTAELATWIVAHDPLEVVAWDDPLVEQLGHPARSAYVETYWLPIIGPASTWAMRRLTAWLDAEPAGYTIELSELARELGLGTGTGRNAPVVRTLARLVGFGLAAPTGGALAVRRAMAPLTTRQACRLPTTLAAQHEREGRSAGSGGVLCGSAASTQVVGGAELRSGKPGSALSANHVPGGIGTDGATR